MNTKSQVPTRILFAEESFSNAIENKNVEEVANIIREACYDYEFEGRFETPVCEILSAEAPERFKTFKKPSYRTIQNKHSKISTNHC